MLLTCEQWGSRRLRSCGLAATGLTPFVVAAGCRILIKPRAAADWQGVMPSRVGTTPALIVRLGVIQANVAVEEQFRTVELCDAMMFGLTQEFCVKTRGAASAAAQRLTPLVQEFIPLRERPRLPFVGYIDSRGFRFKMPAARSLSGASHTTVLVGDFEDEGDGCTAVVKAGPAWTRYAFLSFAFILGVIFMIRAAEFYLRPAGFLFAGLVWAMVRHQVMT